MALSLPEKQHWKNRIESKLTQRISQLQASDPALLQGIQDEAKREIYSSRQLDEDFDQLTRIQEEATRLKAEKQALLDNLYLKLFDEKPDGGSSLHCIERQLELLERNKTTELLSNHSLGRQIARLREEKENLMDAILLAVDIRHVIDIWDKVTYLVTSQVPEPEQETLFSEQEAA